MSVQVEAASGIIVSQLEELNWMSNIQSRKSCSELQKSVKEQLHVSNLNRELIGAKQEIDGLVFRWARVTSPCWNGIWINSDGCRLGDGIGSYRQHQKVLEIYIYVSSIWQTLLSRVTFITFIQLNVKGVSLGPSSDGLAVVGLGLTQPFIQYSSILTTSYFAAVITTTLLWVSH